MDKGVLTPQEASFIARQTVFTAATVQRAFDYIEAPYRRRIGRIWTADDMLTEAKRASGAGIGLLNWAGSIVTFLNADAE